MRRRPGLPFLLFLILPAALGAQSIVTIAPQQCVWRAGDNPAWAGPSLDESGWQPYSAWKIDARTPRIWVRCRASLAPLRALNHPALQVHLRAASQMFVNGALAGSSGNFASAQFSMGDFYTVPLAPASLTPAAVLALRISFLDLTQTTPAEMLLGDQPALQDHRAAAALSGALGYLPIGLCFSLIGVVGFMLLGLWVTDRSRLELLLLAVVCWCVCLLRLNEFCSFALVPMSYTLYSFLYGSGQLLEVFWIWFIFRIAGKRVPWFYRVAIAVTFIFFVNLSAGAVLPAVLNLRQDALYNSIAGFVMVAGMTCATAPLAAFWPWNRISRNLRAIAFFCMAWGVADFVWFMSWECNILGLVSNSNTAFVQKYLLILRASTTLCSVLALLTIIFREQRRIAQDRAQLAGEMQAAREIQQYLIPEKLPPTPGLTIRSVYHPSREVGGDFFQVLPDPRDGSTLIVVGDVAGKGLKAGMLAALIVGSIRTAFKFTSDPGSILALLNERLLDRGLVTCLAMRVDRNGNIELANAGQLPPYINGRELALEGALPLGALPAVSFPSQRFQLSEGAPVLLVSDGVIEARNAAGELFGFERTRAISTQPAETIAQAAQAFGQEDDITVLTLSLAAAEVVHA
ncbi:MAG: PP2C family protein-serine/threonine phosphatase [Terracidiphilus sp.]